MTRRRAAPSPIPPQRPTTAPPADTQEAAGAALDLAPMVDEAPVDEAVGALLEAAGVACKHTLTRSRYKSGRWTRYCEACGDTWPLEV